MMAAILSATVDPASSAIMSLHCSWLPGTVATTGIGPTPGDI